MISRKRLVKFAAMLVWLGVSQGAWALPAAPAQSSAFSVSDALLDSITKTSATQLYNTQQGLLGYDMTFHDANYEYTEPLCANVVMIDGSGARIQSASVFNPGDNLVISVGPNPQVSSNLCITYIVRQVLTQSSNGTNCLQNYEVTHTIAPADSPLLPNKQYTFNLVASNRPTQDCDAGIYGTTPVTPNPAADTSFDITISQGSNQLLRLSLTTDSTGKASFNYTFPTTGNNYVISLTSSGDRTPGDYLTWMPNVENATPAATPLSYPLVIKRPGPAIWPIFAIAAAVIIPLAIGALEFYLMLKKRRAHELPIDEYMRTPRV